MSPAGDRDRLDRLNDIVRAGWPEVLGMYFDHVEPHGLVAVLEVSDRMLAPNGMLHGGVLASFADTACGVATIEKLGWNREMFATTQLQSTFDSSSDSNRLFCVWELAHSSRGVMTWSARVVEPEGRHVAGFRCTQRIRPFAGEETLEYVTLDVFGDRFAGNPLAVVFDAGGLDDAEMMKITREFNYSETVFLRPPDSSRYPVRIFTPGFEVPFAGHPTIGTAVALALESGSGDYILGEKIGDVRVSASVDRPGRGHAWFEVPRVAEPGPPVEVDPSDAMSVIGLTMDELHPDRAIMHYDGGIRFTLVPLRSEMAVRQARLDLARWTEVFENSWAAQLYLFSETADRDVFCVRLFAPAAGVLEDPATGSAAAVLGRFVADDRGDGEHELTILQGDEVGRPSTIGLRVERKAGGSIRIEVSGSAEVTMRGRLLR